MKEPEPTPKSGCSFTVSYTHLDVYKRQDVNSPAIDVGFKVADTNLINNIFGSEVNGAVYAVIWTTTPWTLPANQAVSVNAELIYALFEVKKGKFIILAKDLLDACLKRYELETNDTKSID